MSLADVVILPPGWTGRWDVIETLRKVYAIY
ncbi:cupin domain-containing protein [Amaricoccus solimangrovi]|nr:cupin domain-containing protein [Amaricoccus solimangrovi]